MSKKNNNKSSGSGWTLLAAVVGAGIGFAASKIIEAIS